MSTSEIQKLVITLVLTTGCGAFLAFIFQRIHFRNQWRKNRWEKELESSQKVFEEISRLLDRRLYRTLQFFWALQSWPEMVETKLQDYRHVLIEWNDNINRILALLAFFFDDPTRKFVDEEIGTEFVSIGQELEKTFQGQPSDMSQIEQRLAILEKRIYNFNLRLLTHIRVQRERLYK